MSETLKCKQTKKKCILESRSLTKPVVTATTLWGHQCSPCASLRRCRQDSECLWQTVEDKADLPWGSGTCRGLVGRQMDTQTDVLLRPGGVVNASAMRFYGLKDDGGKMTHTYFFRASLRFLNLPSDDTSFWSLSIKAFV